MTGFQEVLAELNVTEEEFNADLAMRLQHGFAPIEQGAYATVGPSEIHGNGAFSVCETAQGEYAIVVRTNGQLTREGAAVNHSSTPNCELAHTPAGNLYLVALRDICIGEELTHDYRHPTWRTDK